MTDAQLEPFPDDWDRALVIVAHPDDVEWGMSAAVATWTAAGRQVDYVLATRGEAGIEGLDPAEAGPVREAEQRAACDAVGVSGLTFLGHRDGRVEEGVDLRRDIAAAIRRGRPHVVVTLNHAERWAPNPGAGWNSADHRAVGRAAIDAVSDAANEWIFPELASDGLERWGGTRWIAVAAAHQPTHAIDVAGHLDRAVASLAAHRRYLEAIEPEADPVEYARRLVEHMVSLQAPRFGGRPAVAFELLAGPAASS